MQWSAEDWVSDVLVKFGYEVDRVPEGSDLTPDFLARKSDEVMIVEVKSRRDNDERKKCLKRDGMWEFSSSMEKQNTLSQALKKARRQINQVGDGICDPIRIVWVVDQRTPPERHFVDEVAAVLYGQRSILHYNPIDHDDPRDAIQSYKVLYFANTMFYSRRDIDLVVVGVPGYGFSALLNEYSVNLDRLGELDLVQRFNGAGALFDPRRAEENGFLVADCDCSRNDQSVVLRFLKDKYKFRCYPQVCNPQHYEAHVVVNAQKSS